VDQDATIIESRKGASLAYLRRRARLSAHAGGVGGDGYAVLVDQFRDGNVPAMMEPLPVAQRAFAALPPTVQSYYFRGDSACHESSLISWLRDEQRADGPQGFIGFAISARMSDALHQGHPASPGIGLGSLWEAAHPRDTGVRRD